VQLGGHRARLFVQQAVDHGVDVLIGRNRLRAIGDALPHPIEPAPQLFRFIGREHPGLAERQRPRLGESHIMRPQPEVGADGAVDGVEQRGRAAGEATAPEFMRAVVGHQM